MPDMFDQQYLLSNQYNSAAKLMARIQLHERFSIHPIEWQQWVFDQFEIAPNSRILELGSGPGKLWLKNLERLPASWEIMLTDFSAGMLQETRQNLSASAFPFQFEVADAQSLPFADDSFDVVIANHMLYHVPDRPRAFAEIRRVLRPQGRFYAATNGEGHLREIQLLCERAGIKGGSGLLSGGSMLVFSLQNGSEQMTPWFPRIDLRRQQNDLAVTEVEPLLAYIVSCVNANDIDNAKLRTLRTLIEQELAERGAVHITREAGVFIASGNAA